MKCMEECHALLDKECLNMLDFEKDNRHYLGLLNYDS